MKKLCLPSLLLVAAAVNAAAFDLTKDSDIDSIISTMTLDEKVAMLHGKTIMSSEGVPRLGIQEIRYADGPFAIRREVGEHFRPMNLPTDSSTYFPTGSALAATWDPGCAYRYGQAMSVEARLRGKDMILGPAINIQRLPVGGRSYEYLSEDPILSGDLAVAYTKGAQKNGTAVCIKHFAVNNQEANRGTVNAVVDQRTLHEIYLRPFEDAVVEADALGVMPAYNKVNGVYCSENDYLNNKVLRDLWGFRGITVSDWGGTHSTVGAAFGGLDVQMPGDQYFGQALADSVRAGKVPMAIIDAKVKNILRVRGLIRQIPPAEANLVPTSQPESRNVAYEVALRAIVLMKNSGNVLPLKNNVKKIAVIGENARMSTASGGVGADACPPYEITPLQGISQAAAGIGAEVVFAPAYPVYLGRFGKWGKAPAGAKVAADFYQEPDPELLAGAVAAAKGADVVFFFTGTNKYIETEGSDRDNIDLPVSQARIFSELLKVNPNVVVVNVSGGPCDLSAIDAQAKAVFQSWWNGMEGGRALADVIFGKVSPSGRLPFTFPKKLSDSPAFALGNYPQTDQIGADVFLNEISADAVKDAMAPSENAFYSEGSLVGYRWYDTKGIAPLYPFGHGLTYSDVKYENIQAIRSGEDIIVKFVLTNRGHMPVEEVAQVYVSRPQSVIEWPAKELKAYSRVPLMPNQTREVSLTIPAKDLQYWDVDSHARRTDPSAVTVMVGASSGDIRLTCTDI